MSQRDRQIAVDYQAELAVAGWYCVLQSAHPRTSPVRGECFSDDGLRALWEYCCGRDTWTFDEVFDRVDRHKDVAFLGGTTTLFQALTDAPRAHLGVSQIQACEKRMVNAWARRHLARELGNVVEELYAGKVESVLDATDRVRAALGQAEAGSLRGSVTLADGAKRTMERWISDVRESGKSDHGSRTIPLPLPALRNRIGGFMRGRFYVVGARTSEHKTTFVRQCCWHAAQQGYRSLHWTLEDNLEDLAARTIAAEVPGFAWGELVTGKATKSHFEQLGALADGVDALVRSDAAQRFRLLDVAGPKLSTMIGTLRAEGAKGLDLVGIDYFQLIEDDVPGPKEAEFYRRATGQLARLAKELDCAIVVTSQITTEGNKETKSRNGQLRVPMPWDMLYHGPLTQDAAGVFMLGFEDIKPPNARPGDKLVREWRVVVDKFKAGEPRFYASFVVDAPHDTIREIEHRYEQPEMFR